MIFQWLEHDIWPCWCHQTSLEPGPGTWILQKPKKDISILIETHINHDQIHHARNNWLGPMFFSPGDSHTKGTLFLLHMGLEGITEVNNDSKMTFVSLRLLPLMKEFSVCSPSGYSTREQLSMGALYWSTTKSPVKTYRG